MENFIHIDSNCPSPSTSTSMSMSNSTPIEENGIVEEPVERTSPNAASLRPTRSPWQVVKTLVFRVAMILLITRFLRQPTKSSSSTKDLPSPSAPSWKTRFKASNLCAPGDLMDLYIFINEDSQYNYHRAERPIIKIEQMKYADWTSNGTWKKFVEFPISETVQNNGSIYLHLVLSKHGQSIDPEFQSVDARHYTFSQSKRLNKYRAKVAPKTNEETRLDFVSSWHSNLTVNLLDDQSIRVKGSVPAPLNQYLKFDVHSGNYYPVVFFNDYWNSISDYFPIDSTLPVLNLTLTFAPIQLWKWQIYHSDTLGRSNWRNFFNEEDQKKIKRLFIDPHSYLLISTIVVTVVHTIFEFLAFKNDVEFWRGQTSLHGLSLQSILWRSFQTFIIFLYVFYHPTNILVRITVSIGLIIELWKVTKVYRFVARDPSSGTIASDKDRMLLRYLLWALFPIFLVCTLHLWISNEPSSFFAFSLDTIYGFSRNFGFFMMTPQFFLNDQLKSVSHLPWRTMSYRALNNLIDHVSPVVLPMPNISPFECFRDDLIFLISFFQRSLYRSNDGDH